MEDFKEQITAFGYVMESRITNKGFGREWTGDVPLFFAYVGK